MYMYSGEESTHSLTKEISMPYLQNLHWTELCSKPESGIVGDW